MTSVKEAQLRPVVQRSWIWPAMAIFLLLAMCSAGLLNLLAGEIAKDQKTLLGELYWPATRVAIVTVTGAEPRETPVHLVRCGWGRFCFQVLISREMQAQPALLQAVLEAVVCPLTPLKQPNASQVLGGSGVGAARLKHALVLGAAADSCGRSHADPRHGLQLELLFQETDSAGPLRLRRG